MSVAEKFEVIADEIYELGKEQSIKDFWDTYYTNSIDIFGSHRYASANTFYNWYSPMLKYFIPTGTLIVQGNAGSCFRYFCRDLNGKDGAINFVEFLNKCNCVLDTSKVTTSNFLFSEVGLTHLPKLDLSSVTGTHNSVFYRSYSLVSIAEIVSNVNAKWTTCFDGCTKLENVIFTGLIGNDIDFKDCSVLNGNSIMSIVDALSTTVTGKTLTLSKVAVNNAFATSEGAADGSTTNTWLGLISNRTNWTITLV